jgi:hypothetical protein
VEQPTQAPMSAREAGGRWVTVRCHQESTLAIDGQWAAIEAVLASEPAFDDDMPPFGCSTRWRPGIEAAAWPSG